jgi:hypothetical protein
MNYLSESVLVGIYTLIIYIIIFTLFRKMISIEKSPEYFFFLLGFMKHFLGDFIQLHTFFCNNGYSCKYYFNDSNILYRISKRKELVIFTESILEGLFFVFIYFLLFSTIKNFQINWFIIFCIGFSLHILFELIGIHRLFCKYRCSSVLYQ